MLRQVMTDGDVRPQSEAERATVRAEEAVCAVLFADIVDSTRFYKALGDRKARKVIRACLDGLTDVVVRSGGRVVDRTRGSVRHGKSLQAVTESGEYRLAIGHQARHKSRQAIVVQILLPPQRTGGGIDGIREAAQVGGDHGASGVNDRVLH